ncbi:enoyl-CoA hydratase-related protein [Streptosporangium amethystogenes]|uniref:enoyl-CoA hydratase-related protein n=1 Tax=Streptosporangium amethystogenes TaxID=2002 RepID=UPI00068FCDC2|nr:enoyl-CoA hydratase-related protein [Streptosporangium amethystogenes]
MTSTEPKFVRYEIDEGVAVITLDRPDRLNALIPPMTRELIGLLDRADLDDAVRAVVLTGAGRGFCGGADFERLRTVEASGVVETHRALRRDRAMRLRKPLIAAVNGAVGGAGLAHALMADIRFAAAGAKWTTAFARYGLVAEMGTSWLLTRLVGMARAKDLLFSGRVFSSEEAYEYGLVQFVHPADEVLERSVRYARELAAVSPYSISQMREQIHADLERDWDTAYWDSVERTQNSIGWDTFRRSVPGSQPS